MIIADTPVRMGVPLLASIATNWACNRVFRAGCTIGDFQFGLLQTRRHAKFQKSGLSAWGTAEFFPGYHWMFWAQTCSSRSSKARRNVTVAAVTPGSRV